jgi:hypothetical protein
MSQDRREKIQDMLLDRVEHALVDFDKIDWSKERYFHRVEVLRKLGQAVQYASSGMVLNDLLSVPSETPRPPQEPPA